MNHSANHYGKLQNKAERGTGIIEFAIILPLFLLIVLGIIEFSKVVIIREELASFAREAANAAYRSCPNYGQNGETCNQQIADQIRNAAIAANYSPARLRIIVSTYNSNFNEQRIGASGSDVVNVDGYNFPLTTRFDWTNIQSSILNEILTPSNPAQKRVGFLTIGEIFYVHNPLFTFIPGVQRGVLYENAIF